MGDQQATKKKNRKKKKSTSGESSNGIKEVPEQQEKNQASNLSEILPQKVGCSTMINEMEVTMMQGNSEVAADKKQSKKKKKSAKQSSSESVEETLRNANEDSPDLLNFSENGGIRLVNHPEISVTLNKVPKEVPTAKTNVSKEVPTTKANSVPKEVKLNNTTKSTSVPKDLKLNTTTNTSASREIKLTNIGDSAVLNNQKEKIPKEEKLGKESSKDAKTYSNTQQEHLGDTATGANGTKKKKKKKKKNSQSESVPTPSVDEVPELSAPTYVKLPATGDTCVLVVSHESFANGNVTDKTKPPTGNANVSNAIDKSQNESLKKNDFVTLVNKNPISTPLIPISFANVMQNVNPLQPVPFTMNTTSSISLTPISNTHEESISNTNEETVSNANEEPCSNQQKDGEIKLTKAQLKAERRAKQEAQRAAKEIKNAVKTVDKSVALVTDKSTASKEAINIKISPRPDFKAPKDVTKQVSEKDHQVRLFSHLPQLKTLDILLKHISKVGNRIHPAILDIGTKFSRGIVCGSNSRCIALLAAVKEVIKDHIKPADKEFLKDLDSKLQFCMSYLQDCRPLSVSMVNAMKFLKHQINHIDKELDDSSIKDELIKFINRFVREEILLAKEQIGTCAADKIVCGDVILVYAYSSLVKEVLFKAFRQNKKFRVVVVDSRPKMEGLKMLNCLTKEGILCSYTLINGISYAMKEVSKVIIGAHALLSNGYVMSRMGCSQIALVASSYSVPVLVCCETYKFWERVLTDSFVHNELGHPEVLVNTGKENEVLKGWQEFPSLQLLNLLYDVTPPDLISVVITEKGVLPCTSVPVVLRVRHAGLQE